MKAVLRFCCAVYYAVQSGSNWSVFNTHHLFKSWNSKFWFCNSYKLLRLIICTLVSSGECDKFQWGQMRYYLVKLYLVTRTVLVNSYDLFKWYNWWNCISLSKGHGQLIWVMWVVQLLKLHLITIQYSMHWNPCYEGVLPDQLWITQIARGTNIIRYNRCLLQTVVSLTTCSQERTA